MRAFLSTFTIISLLAMITLPTHAEETHSTAFTLNTNAFLDTGALPVLYTCDGKDVSPQLTWTNVPPKTQSLALLITDPDAPNGTFYHWVLYNIPTSTTTLPESSSKVPAGIQIGKNSFNQVRYNGPCPPKGTTHTYVLTLYGLDTKLNLPAGTDGKEVEKAISKHVTGKTQLTTVYSRWLR